jgi:hypothetical protein
MSRTQNNFSVIEEPVRPPPPRDLEFIKYNESSDTSDDDYSEADEDEDDESDDEVSAPKKDFYDGLSFDEDESYYESSMTSDYDSELDSNLESDLESATESEASGVLFDEGAKDKSISLKWCKKRKRDDEDMDFFNEKSKHFFLAKQQTNNESSRQKAGQD